MDYSQEEIQELLEKVQKSNGVITARNYFIQVPNSFIRRKDLDTNEKMMYMYLWGFGGETMNMYPSQGRMKSELGWGKQKIISVLKSLELKGGVYIINRKYRDRNEKATNLYYLAEINTNDGSFIERSISIVKVLYPDKFTYAN